MEEDNVLEEHISEEEIESMFESARRPNADMESLIKNLGEFSIEYEDEDCLPDWAKEQCAEDSIRDICNEVLDDVRSTVKVVRASHYKIDSTQEAVRDLAAEVSDLRAEMGEFFTEMRKILAAVEELRAAMK